MMRSVLAATLAAAILFGATACGGSGGAPETFSVKFDTTKGSFVIAVTRSWAPIGADRFYKLVSDHFYDNQPLFRVYPGFVVQWGISSTPSVAQKWQSDTMQDDPPKHSNDKGTITFAKTNLPNSRSTQVFVNLADNTNLDGMGFSPFGTITSGFSVFNRLYSGYGEDPSNNQPSIVQYGAPWVRQHYPELDWIKTARLVP